MCIVARWIKKHMNEYGKQRIKTEMKSVTVYYVAKCGVCRMRLIKKEIFKRKSIICTIHWWIVIVFCFSHLLHLCCSNLSPHLTDVGDDECGRDKWAPHQHFHPLNGLKYRVPPTDKSNISSSYYTYIRKWSQSERALERNAKRGLSASLKTLANIVLQYRS